MINLQHLNAIVALSKTYNSLNQIQEAMLYDDGAPKKTILAELRVISDSHTSVQLDGGVHLSEMAHEKLSALIAQIQSDIAHKIRRYGLTLDDLPQIEEKDNPPS